MNKITILIIAAASVVLAACQTTNEAPKDETYYMHLKTMESFANGVVGKTLNIDDDSIVIAEDGTWAGTFNGKDIGGDWEFVDGNWCRTITDGEENCQKYEMSSTFDTIMVTRDMGEGDSYVYTISQ